MCECVCALCLCEYMSVHRGVMCVYIVGSPKVHVVGTNVLPHSSNRESKWKNFGVPNCNIN